MLIHRRRPRTEGNTRFKLRVLIGTERIEMVKKHRILGLTFDERLNWKEHIKDVKARVTRKLNLLKSLFGARKRNRTVQRNIGTKKTTTKKTKKKQNKTKNKQKKIGKEEESTNQDSDRNEERRRCP
jgi:hypothetical protein